MMKIKNIAAAVAGLAAGAAGLMLLKKLRKAPADPPETAAYVDLYRYLGDWYDLGHYPAWFQRNSYGTMAHYSLDTDGSIKVVNTSYKGPDGPLKTATAKAWVADKTSNAKLKVQFYWPFSGDYWILEVDPDYQWAIVGHPAREYLWLLSREPFISTRLLDSLLEKVSGHGYEPERIVWEEHKLQR
jgi:apolipoprotein D and lipocalin family protein